MKTLIPQKERRAAAAMSSTSLPEEIQVDILSRLPVKSIITCKCVCKAWLDLISHPTFIKYHLNQNKNNHRLLIHKPKTPWIWSVDICALISSSSETCEAVSMVSPFQYYEHDQIRILGSCNGLICFWDSYHRHSDSDCICVWNPATKEYKEIPLPSHLSNISGHGYNRNSYEECNIICGFGYDCNIDNYKLVTFVKYKRSSYIQGEVYTLGSDLWKTIPVHSCYSFRHESPGLLLNGALHWLCVNTSQNKSTILSFNISTEILINLPVPAENILQDSDCYDLGVLGECLCLVCVSEWVGNDVWVMLNYGVRESWTKQFTLTQCCSTGYFSDYKVLRSLYKGEILLHDPNNGSKLEVCFQYHEGGCVYAESLVSLDSGIYAGRAKNVGAKRTATKTYMQALIN